MLSSSSFCTVSSNCRSEAVAVEEGERSWDGVFRDTKGEEEETLEALEAEEGEGSWAGGICEGPLAMDLIAGEEEALSFFASKEVGAEDPSDFELAIRQPSHVFF